MSRLCSNNKVRPWVKLGVALMLLVAVTLLAACTDIGYYAQGVAGHLDLMRRSEPIEEVLSRAETSAELAQKLREVQAIRNYASSVLYLPENGSYRRYADLQRTYVVWNLVAAPELEAGIRSWCFPVAGCVSYRGYFSEQKAKQEKLRIEAGGDDVYLYGVSAYSTLSWFDDPVLNTMLRQSRTRMAALIFHELSHQVVYVPGDSPFNEAFARAVEFEAVRRYLLDQGRQDEYAEFLRLRSREGEFIALVLKVRQELDKLYGSALDDERKRTEKSLSFDRLRSQYAELRQQWGGFTGYDRWFAGELNNAKLASVSTYNRYVPAFETLMLQENRDFRRFFARVKEYAGLDELQRRIRLEALLKQSPVRVALKQGD